MTLERARGLLRELERGDLAGLLEYADYGVYVDKNVGWIPTTILLLRAPEPYAEAIEGLSDNDKKRIREAFEKVDPSDKADQLSAEADVHRELQPEQKLLGEIVAEQNMMNEAATGRKRFPEVDDYYRARRRRIHRTLSGMGLDDPNPHASLWDWYKVWPGSWAGRRAEVRTMYAALLEKLTEKPHAVPAREPTGWDRVDRTVDKARVRLDDAAKEEDFQSVGLLCREVLISLAQAVFDADRHKILDGVKASDTDAKRLLEAYFAVELSGGEHEATRKHARAALDLAVALQHRRSADFRFAALCLEATSSVINIVAIVSGRRDRNPVTGSPKDLDRVQA